MKKIFLLMIFAFALIHGEENGKNWAKTVSENASKITTIKSSFKQEKTLSFLSEKVTSGGKFFFEKSGNDNRLKWEYTTPFTYTIVIDGKKITMKDGKKVTCFDMSSSRVFEEINEIMIKSLNGTILSDNKNFVFDIKEIGRELVIGMIPAKGTSLSEYFKSIKMIMDKNDFTVSMLTITELSGDSTELVFSEKILNGKIDDKEFVVQ